MPMLEAVTQGKIFKISKFQDANNKTVRVKKARISFYKPVHRATCVQWKKGQENFFP